MWKLLFLVVCVLIAACDDDRPPPLATSNSVYATGFGSTLKVSSRDGVARMAWIDALPRDFTERKGMLVEAGRFRQLNVGAPQYVDWSVFEGAWIGALVLEPIRCDVSTYGYIVADDTCKRAEQSFLPPGAFKYLPTIKGLRYVHFQLNRQELDDNFYRRLSEFIVSNPMVSVGFQFLPGEFDFCRLRVADAKQRMGFKNTSLNLPDEAYRMVTVPKGKLPRELGDVFYDPRKGNITRSEVSEMENYIYQRPYTVGFSSFSRGRDLNEIISRGSGNKALWNHNCVDPE